MVLILYGVSGSGKRTCCDFLAKEARVTLQDIDVFDSSTFSLPSNYGYSHGLSRMSSNSFVQNKFRKDNGEAVSLADELFSTYTSRSVSLRNSIKSSLTEGK